MNQTLFYVLGFCGMVVVGLVGWYFRRSMDDTRIRGVIASRGGRLLESTWATGGLGFRVGAYDDSRSWYRIRYLDREGNERSALCSSGRFGVEIEDETVTRYVDEPDHPSAAQEYENHMLREEAERLARKPKDKPE